jgi:amino acid adenylation domain-containing protein
METSYNLAAPFCLTASRSPDLLAVSADGKERTYRETLARVQGAASWLSCGGQTPRYVGILATRSWEACVGILAAAWAGAAYVPLNPRQPGEALVRKLGEIELDALIVDHGGARGLTPEVMRYAPRKVLAPQPSAVPGQGHEVWSFDNLDSDCGFAPRALTADDPAYVEFTSGSTGTPKGVVVPNSAVSHFLRMMQERYQITPEDRVAETTDTSFDVSVFNMFMPWAVGASLHVVPRSQAIAPAKLIRQHQITIWFSVPSVATAMSRMGLLTPGAFPSLRATLFAGEPLPARVAIEWKQAAPNSVLDNLYGPTEATVVCLAERAGEKLNITKDRGIVAIGRPLQGTLAAVWDSASRRAAPGVVGELVLAGPQLAQGYFNSPEKTAARFVQKDGRRWYLSGDLAYEDEAGVFHHMGRIDNQVKVLGHRVELEEIEAHLRQVYGSDSVAAVAWPTEFGTAAGIVAFVSAPAKPNSDHRDELRQRLPSHMVPTAVHVVEVLPLNISGKVDRTVLAQGLQEGKF